MIFKKNDPYDNKTTNIVYNITMIISFVFIYYKMFILFVISGLLMTYLLFYKINIPETNNNYKLIIAHTIVLLLFGYLIY
ncbi:MAG: hypothetical protein IJ880_14825 [Bacilli bacterium]|nr:hypothetical protein [Bacilli bacterium]